MVKPKKPYREFPLFPHASGQWAKKLKGKTCYFGVWADPTAALDLYEKQRSRLERGLDPVAPEGVTVDEACNTFLHAKQSLIGSGEMKERTWREYKTCCQRIVAEFGRTTKVIELTADDFNRLRKTLAAGRSPVVLNGEIQRVRSVFKYAYDAELIDKPVRTGPQFRRVPMKLIREARNKKPKQFVKRSEIRKMLSQADRMMRCMILLAINCGFGQSDIAQLPLSAVDLKDGWIRYPRPKTAIHRDCPLWPETVKALRIVLKHRKAPTRKELVDLVFITRKGFPFLHYSMESGTTTDAIGLRYGRLRKLCGITRKGTNFYALRHTFQTVADNTKDAVAIRRIMGHTDPQGDMSAEYREWIDAARLVAVVDHVHEWLFK